MKNIKTINLWEGKFPTQSGLTGHQISDPDGVLELTNVTETELIIYSPDSSLNTGIATVICPGGAYAGLAITSQGHDFAIWLSSIGITGIVLKYRMPNGNKEIPLDDLQKAISYVRGNAASLGINENKIGVTGFSAGGHLAALASTLFSEVGLSNRPDFSILFYPVISMGRQTQSDTRKNLLGDNPSPETIEKYSCESQVLPNTPATLILVSDDDTVVNPVNSTLYYQALKQYDIPAALHVFPQGDHAWGIKGVNMFGGKFDYTEEMKSLIIRWIMRFATEYTCAVN